MNTIKRFSDLPDVHVRGEALSEPVFWIGVQWAVTSYGVEKRDGTYVIEAARVWEEDHPGYTWERHMAEKGWVDGADLSAALAFARARWPKGKPIAEKTGGLALDDAYMAWCPVNTYTASHPRVGQVVVGTQDQVEGQLDGPDGLPSWIGVCANMGAETTPETRLVIMFSNFVSLVVRDGLDPAAVHTAFLAINEYRGHIAPDVRGAAR